MSQIYHAQNLIIEHCFRCFYSSFFILINAVTDLLGFTSHAIAIIFIHPFFLPLTSQFLTKPYRTVNCKVHLQSTHFSSSSPTNPQPSIISTYQHWNGLLTSLLCPIFWTHWLYLHSIVVGYLKGIICNVMPSNGILIHL